ncbi:hypothetical protein CALCODRAFT_143840 [Calocera cornea HHB12733]|uniref:Uncharacterized protein n=1 Tax=Calocera cornea HHB12733 TaxID=1353952 RepID=A0A165I7M1_9BASI|nr:hypothetical protein CALCODRAFT_143840 [Calocera cornea HHB12733]
MQIDMVGIPPRRSSHVSRPQSRPHNPPPIQITPSWARHNPGNAARPHPVRSDHRVPASHLPAGRAPRMPPLGFQAPQYTAPPPPHLSTEASLSYLWPPDGSRPRPTSASLGSALPELHLRRRITRTG